MFRTPPGPPPPRLARLALAALVLASRAAAGEVQLSPFGGLQFGGSVHSPASGTRFHFDESSTFGFTVDVPIDPRWRFEILFSRQSGELHAESPATPAFPHTIERYMVGIEEEPETESVFRVFGVGLLGATRLVPGVVGGDTQLKFAAGLSLGAKVLASKRVGFRFEARGFCTFVEAGAAFYCAGSTCLLQFRGSGIWQGDITAGLILRL